MGILKLRDVVLGEGRPKICVPLTSRTLEGLLLEIDEFKKSDADLVEWRADYFESCLDENKMIQALGEIRTRLVGAPLIFTFRTKNEGGECEISKGSYASLYKKIIETGSADAVDIELNIGVDLICEISETAREKNTACLISYHDFKSTPEKKKIIGILNKMVELGADIAKVAVVPKDFSDVLTLLAATEEFSSKADCPVITMSMGKLGSISRVSGKFSGSAMTFGTIKNSSAPGQLSVSDLLKILDIFEK